MAQEKVNLSLGYLALRKTSVDAIRKQSGKEDVGPILAAQATYCLNEFGDGALLLTGKDLSQLERTTGQQFATAEDVVKAVQHSLKRDDGQHCLVVQIDPAFIPNLEEVARWQSVTPEDVMNDIVNTVVSNSWCYSWEVKGGEARFDKADWEQIKAVTGKAIPTGRDIVKALAAKG